ncbi:MAG: Sb-PDE family phosphodiesterase [Bacteroidota bacterium]
MRLLTYLLVLCSCTLAAQHQHPHRSIDFPDTDKYRTLVVDLHMHTVFSDGSVWPDIRVEEAVRDEVDAISLTEHLEYQPHAADIPHPDRNRSHNLAKKLARPHDLIVIRGAEITRSLPPGHSNAIFIEDANKLNVEDPYAAFAEAKRQGAFTFWNHPNYIAQRDDGVAVLTDFHRQLIEKDLLHGIEVVNDLTISKEALQIALDHDLTIMGTSDIHGLVDWQYQLNEGGHRPVTLVLATARTESAIEAALRAGRTIAWFENTLVGKESNLAPLVAASLTVSEAAYFGSSAVVEVSLHNESDAEYLLENLSGYSLQSDLGLVKLAPHQTTKISVMTLQQLEEFSLKFRVLNAVTGPEERLEISIPVQVD